MATQVDQALIDMVLPKVRNRQQVNPPAGGAPGTPAIHPNQVRPGAFLRDDPNNPGRMIPVSANEIPVQTRQEVQQETRAEYEQTLGSLNSAPGQNIPVPIESLTPDQQTEYWRKFRAAQSDFVAQFGQPPSQTMVPVQSQVLTSDQPPQQLYPTAPAPNSTQGLQDYRITPPQQPSQPVGVPNTSFVQRAPQPQTPPFNPQIPQAQPAYQPPPQQQPQPQRTVVAPPPTPESLTGAVSVSPVCKLCGHDNRESTEVVETEEDWRNFLATFASGKPFERVYSVAEGKISLTLRDLTVSESDACYDAAFRALREGRISNDIEFGDLLIRYQVAIQVKKIFGSGLNYEAPEGSHPSLYQGAQDYWSTRPDGQIIPVDQIVAVIDEAFTQAALKNVVFQGIILRVRLHFSNLMNRIRYRAADPKKY